MGWNLTIKNHKTSYCKWAILWVWRWHTFIYYPWARMKSYCSWLITGRSNHDHESSLLVVFTSYISMAYEYPSVMMWYLMWYLLYNQPLGQLTIADIFDISWRLGRGQNASMRKRATYSGVPKTCLCKHVDGDCKGVNTLFDTKMRGLCKNPDMGTAPQSPNKGRVLNTIWKQVRSSNRLPRPKLRFPDSWKV